MDFIRGAHVHGFMRNSSLNSKEKNLLLVVCSAGKWHLKNRKEFIFHDFAKSGKH